jgi:hypothetical protein
MAKSLLSGDKFNSNHQTYIPNAKPLLISLKSLDSVKKIFLGKIVKAKNGKQSAKINKLNAGVWDITFRGAIYIQEFRVVCSNEEELKELMTRHNLNKSGK